MILFRTAVLGLAIAASATAATAESLADAIASAYETNPTLAQARAQQRVLDEGYVVARTGLRPTAGLSAGAQWSQEAFGRGGGLGASASGTYLLSPGAGTFDSNAGSAQLTVSQPLYTGGRTASAVRAAEDDVLAGREGLRRQEASVLLAAIEAYVDVLRDQEAAAVRRDNVEVLERQLEETRAKFEAGQVTRTDTAQAEAQLAGARALLTSAQAQVQISAAAYASVVGRPPSRLDAPAALPGLPAKVEDAFREGEAASPLLQEARLQEQASRERVAQARAAFSPTVSVQASLGYAGALSPLSLRDYNRTATAMATVSQPLFTGGLNRSNVRSALERDNADRAAVETTRRAVVQSVAQAWSAMLASRANRLSDEVQVAAARTAVEGAQAEYRAGRRTTLDVLLAQSSLRDAQLALIGARHDEYVAAAHVLSTIGRLEARRLIRGFQPYDPNASFQAARRSGAIPWEGVVESLDGVGAPPPPPAPADRWPSEPHGGAAMLEDPAEAGAPPKVG